MTGVIDWGDAAFADPAMDLAKLPLAVVSSVLDGYRRRTAAAPRNDVW